VGRVPGVERDGLDEAEEVMPGIQRLLAPGQILCDAL
jgi:hypothetical protein